MNKPRLPPEIPIEYDVGVTASTIQEQTLSSLIQICYQYFMPQSGGSAFFKSTTNFYTTVRTIALRLGEIELAKELDEIYEKVRVTRKKFLPLPVLQYIYNRDARLGFSPDHSYEGRSIGLMEIIIALEKSERRIKDIFTKICIENNIDQPAVQRPMLEGTGEMEQL